MATPLFYRLEVCDYTFQENIVLSGIITNFLQFFWPQDSMFGELRRNCSNEAFLLPSLSAYVKTAADAVLSGHPELVEGRRAGAKNF
jgi:hypothetical protein